MMWNTRNRRVPPLVAAALLAAYAILNANGQSPATGFINIDCGKGENYSYTDPQTGLVYTSDFEYVDTGEIHRVDPSFVGSTRYKPAFDLRSFPRGTRNCFTVKPVEKGGKYLVKTSFMYGNYDRKNSTLEFDLYLGVNFWTTVYVSDAYIDSVKEIVTVTTSDQVSICLVNTGSGTPFISVLELRLLPPELYHHHLPSEGTSSQELVLFTRRNLGGNFKRYPKDPYDRSWFRGMSDDSKILTTESPVESRTDKGYEAPTDVMKTAIYPTPSSIFSFSIRPSEFDLLRNSSFVLILHFAELQELKENETRIFNITINDDIVWKRLSPSYLETTTIHTVNSIPIRKFTLLATNQSTLPPIINAAEVLIVRNETGTETVDDDVVAATAIKVQYKMKENWVGDPCSPANFTWYGLKCSDEGFTNFRIVSINLSSRGLSGEISKSFANLSELQYLNLSNNMLTGGVPDALENLKHLKLLDLSGNKLNGFVPKVLLDRAAAGSLTLRIDNTTSNGSLKDEERRGKNNTIKIVIPVIVLAVLLGLLVVFILKRKKKSGKLKVSNTGKRTKSENISSIHSGSNQFSIDDLTRITSNFDRQIGKGGFSYVYLGVLDDGTQVAVKKLFMSASKEQFRTEAHLLSTIHHKNLVSLIDSCNDDGNLALIYEYMAKGSLHDHLTGEDGSTLSWVDRLQISVGAAKGLEYLHSGCRPAIVHRDVKPHNILLNNNMEAKISDFGLSKLFQNDFYTHISTTPAGTPGYLDPAYYSTGMLNEKSDVYSFGVVLLQVITGLPAIMRNNPGNINLVHWVQERVERGRINEIVDKGIYENCDINSVWKIVEMALECASLEPLRRPSMTKVLIMLGECLETEININSNDTEDISMEKMSVVPLQPLTR